MLLITSDSMTATYTYEEASPSLVHEDCDEEFGQSLAQNGQELTKAIQRNG